MGTFFAVAVGIVAVLALICLVAPVRLRLSFNDRKRAVALRWLVINLEGNLKERAFRLSLFDRSVITRKFKKSEEEVKKTKEKRPKAMGKVAKGKKKKSKLGLLDVWSRKELVLRVIRVAFRFLVEILRTIRWDKLCLE